MPGLTLPPMISYFHIDLKRGDDALKNIGILKEFQGIGHYDCYKTCNNYLFIHSRCNTHLLRELNGVVDRDENQENWATAIQSVLLQAKALVVQIVNLPQVPRALCLRSCVTRRSNSPLFSLLAPCYEAKQAPGT
jgi:hypothetical protein